MADEIEALANKYSGEKWVISESDITFGKVLGRGASGTTYVGEHNGEKVAIKAYSLAILKHDPATVKNEMEILARISHPNIVSFCGMVLSTSPPAAALVTRFAPNGELGDAIYNRNLLRKRGNPLRFGVALGLARGLEHLHENDVIHRDLKPANVLLDDDFSPLLTDFGFSRFIDSGGNMTGETGSYKYMAPEVTKHQSYTFSADVYSFAILLNEIFNDEKPFEGLLPIHAAVGVVKKGLRPTQKKITQRFPSLAELAAQGWHEEPTKRPDWKTIIHTLEQAKAEAPISASRTVATSKKEGGASSEEKGSKMFKRFFPPGSGQK
eukprot:CAMPEP_0198314730 /NCGR_PEP_ID=MMETSP1450-20131203/5258_1 /TAXON_ID=753684 ORGANISM="Madagascaria erythrocladiodes, Strain CCMP3234" /NCGR_SAMPLE_ID=MMETSP1450 /ASSEMBLY_ACC=CAM_ASM_001115 /LENGTH=323 /DNA_ID=CAMNT_0044017803 /DNA_START=35 /DNA_END=1006 /DNA_ORIENTATION=+